MLPTTSRGALEGAGFEIIEQQQPSFLLAGGLLVTGEVDRTSGFERGLAIHQACRDGQWQPDPLILDDQALIANVAGKGLVVLTACGHAGVERAEPIARRRRARFTGPCSCLMQCFADELDLFTGLA
jgi:7,8-dihydropterin-6-yl-methyl-4-(beta-D-ribofuranosyl)aminobenzene 5'-phosphate synthase